MASEEDKHEGIELNVPSTAQRDLERRQAEGYAAAGSPSRAGSAGDFLQNEDVPDGYVGVSGEYANYANDTDAPLRSEEGPESEAEKLIEERTLATATDNSEEPVDAVTLARQSHEDARKREEASKATPPTPTKATPTKAAPSKPSSE